MKSFDEILDFVKSEDKVEAFKECRKRVLEASVSNQKLILLKALILVFSKIREELMNDELINSFIDSINNDMNFIKQHGAELGIDCDFIEKELTKNGKKSVSSKLFDKDISKENEKGMVNDEIEEKTTSLLSHYMNFDNAKTEGRYLEALKCVFKILESMREKCGEKAFIQEEIKVVTKKLIETKSFDQCKKEYIEILKENALLITDMAVKNYIIRDVFGNPDCGFTLSDIGEIMNCFLSDDTEKVDERRFKWKTVVSSTKPLDGSELCDICGDALETSDVSFMCGHSFHRYCFSRTGFPGCSDKYCIFCGPDSKSSHLFKLNNFFGDVDLES